MSNKYNTLAPAVQGTVSPPKAANTNSPAVNGAVLLADIEKTLKRFIYLPKRPLYTAVALWTVYTHVYDAFDIAPRLLLWSPTPGNGKSTLLRILNALTRKGHLELQPTEAGLFRNIDMNHPTIILDEADKYLNGNSGVLAVLNGGHMQGVRVTRNVETKSGYVPVNYDLFAPVAYAMKTSKPKEDLLDRSLRINMQKSPKGTDLEKLRMALHGPELEALRQRIEAWAAENRDAILRASPKIPLENRQSDNWFPLFSVADVAGGSWPRNALWALETIETNKGPADAGLKLLANIRQLFDEADADHFLSQDLCDALNANEEWQWGDEPKLTVHRLAQMLGNFEISPRKKRWTGDEQARGYSRASFTAAWDLNGISGTLGTLQDDLDRAFG